MKDGLNKEKPAWKSLIKKDSSGAFLRLREISCGLKLNVALESLRLGRNCKSCECNLARNNVCPTCLKTAKGKAVSLSLRVDKFSSTWDLKSEDDIEKLSKKRRKTFLYTQHPVTILGKTFQVQGYEPAVLKELEPRIQRRTVDPEKMSKVFYSDSKGKKRRYYPDALFQLTSSLNVLLEVKSPYTFSKPQVIHKAKASFNLCDRYRNLQYWEAVHSQKTARLG